MKNRATVIRTDKMTTPRRARKPWITIRACVLLIEVLRIYEHAGNGSCQPNRDNKMFYASLSVMFVNYLKSRAPLSRRTYAKISSIYENRVLPSETFPQTLHLKNFAINVIFLRSTYLTTTSCVVKSSGFRNQWATCSRKQTYPNSKTTPF